RAYLFHLTLFLFSIMLRTPTRPTLFPYTTLFRSIETVKRPLNWTGEAYTGDGIKINSGFLDGLTVAEAKRRAIDWLVERGFGEGKVNYRLRDWGISRQRYWGAPIPVMYCDACGMVP